MSLQLDVTRLAFGAACGGKMGAMADTLVVDASAVLQISQCIFTAADRLAAAGRELRYPLVAPAADPFTLQIRAGLSRAARATGVAACDAADELTRVGEALLANLELMTEIARFTQLAQFGPVVPCPGGPVEFSVAVRRGAGDDDSTRPQRGTREPHSGERWIYRNDDEVLSCALLLARGDEELAGAVSAAPLAVSEIGNELGRLAVAIEEAWPTTTATVLLQRFALWVGGSLEHSASQVVDAHRQWAAAYRTVRHEVSSAAEQYVTIRLGALNGDADDELVATDVDVDGVRSALLRYSETTTVVESVALPEAYPRMKASGSRVK